MPATKKVAASICLIALFAAPTLPAQELRLTGTPWSPYVDADMQRNGFAMALVGHALERAGYDITATVDPWPDALAATMAGERDVFVSLWHTDARAESLAFSEPYLRNEIVFIRLSSSDIRINEREDLDGLRIGVVDDYAYSKEALDTTNIDVQASGSVSVNISRLRAGDLDLVVADRRVAWHEINKGSLAPLFDVLPDPIVTRGLRMAVSKSRDDAADIVQAFESEIAEMRADGSLHAILATFRVSE